MTGEIGVVLLAGLFSLGCIAIHSFRLHAKKVTEVLALIVLCLAPFTLFITLAIQPWTNQRGGLVASPMVQRPMSQPAQAQPSTASSYRLAQAEKTKQESDPAHTSDDGVPFVGPSDTPAWTALPEQDASPAGTGEMPGSPASKNAERIK